MFFVFRSYAYILIAAAIIPAIFLVRYVYKVDRLEKESPSLIGKIVLWGILSTFLAVVLEYVGQFIMNIINFRTMKAYYIFEFFVVVGPVEEFVKYLAVKKAAWKSPEFNCQFDAIVYSVASAMGFALWENLKYVFSYGFSTALIRAVTAIPGHACFGVLLGVWLGAAKRQEMLGNQKAAKYCVVAGWFIASMVHGLYDYLATIESGKGSQIVFFLFIAALFFCCFKLVKRLASHDRYLDPNGDNNQGSY